MSVADDLDRLRRDLGDLPGLAPLARTRAVRELADRVRVVLGRVGDEAVWQATRTASNAEVAATLGVSPSAVAHRVHRHHLATGVALAPGGDRRKGPPALDSA